jgi:hypothetical protein
MMPTPSHSQWFTVRVPELSNCLNSFSVFSVTFLIKCRPAAKENTVCSRVLRQLLDCLGEKA